MSQTLLPLRIEIVDPVAEPLERGGPEVVSATSLSGAGDGWADSWSDAWGAAGAHLAPVGRLVRRVSAVAQRGTRALHDRSLQLRLDGNPRRGSAVREHVFVPFEAVAERLAGLDGSLVAGRGVTIDITSGFETLPSGGRQADADLALRGSWPRLPMVVRVEPWWREQSIVTVELRTRRRLRYPIRYFRSAHASARAIATELSR